MPRGRHRHSAPLHRLLPPTTVAGASIACAAGAWLVGDDLVQRLLAAGAAGAAVGGAVLLRAWDRTAGKRVAELTSARARDEWKTEERIAELETDVEESRELRGALEAKLRSKRAELARLRSEHAALLRRYATAETERASALEGRRLLAIEAAVPAAKALPAVDGADAEVAGTDGANADGARVEGPGAESRTKPGAEPGGLGAEAYRKADRALRRLARNAARQSVDEDRGSRDRGERDRVGQEGAGQERVGLDAIGQGGAGDQSVADQGAADRGAAGRSGGERRAAGGVTGRGVDAADEAGAGGGNGRGGQVAEDRTSRAVDDTRAGRAQRAGRAERAGRPDEAIDAGGRDGAGVRTAGDVPTGGSRVPAAVATAQLAARRLPAPRTTGGFDFFGNSTGRNRQPLPAPLEDDLADVVGDEAVAEQSSRGAAGGVRTTAGPVSGAEPSGVAAGPDVAPAGRGTADGVGEVIDLTAHDETEQFDIAELRSAIS
ncbi:hypothetical protein [Streptomyces sp. MST-110588]|uniref:hypothetical protein n=1 Tax=Streptomyces sp. MST-110588 TaxID=2833628 RepID=UPI001F5DA0EC|nr:hypothetical protein [Streptomyces sp. MST-110588]UNO40614.1 hypothetical protein KGS77_14820 [Streptomyces sp. MST-110588]